MTEDFNVQESPYAEWLEDSIKTILAMQPDSIALVATREEDGAALTGYYEAGAKEMVGFIHQILSDYIMEIIENNADTIRDIVMEEEEEEEP